MRHLRVEVMEMCESAGLYQIDLLNGSKERVSEAEYWTRRRGQMKLDRANAALTAAGQKPKQKKFETVKIFCGNKSRLCCTIPRILKIFLTSSCGSTASPSRKVVDNLVIYLPAERSSSERNISVTSSTKEAVLTALQANAERKRTVTLKPDKIGKLIDIQAKLAAGKGTGYERWAKSTTSKPWRRPCCFCKKRA